MKPRKSRVKCYRIRLESLVSISAKCYKATAFDGSTALVPKSVVYGTGSGEAPSQACWVAAWFMEKPDNALQHSRKHIGWFDKESGRMLPHIVVQKHVPAPKPPVQRPVPQSLKRQA